MRAMSTAKAERPAGGSARDGGGKGHRDTRDNGGPGLGAMWLRTAGRLAPLSLSLSHHYSIPSGRTVRILAATTVCDGLKALYLARGSGEARRGGLTPWKSGSGLLCAHPSHVPHPSYT